MAEEAVGDRGELVTLSDGSSVLIEDWSWAKVQVLYKLVGKFENLQELAEQSLRSEDRKKIPGMKAEDVLKIAVVATRRNMPAIKNLMALADLWGQAAGEKNQGTP